MSTTTATTTTKKTPSQKHPKDILLLLHLLLPPPPPPGRPEPPGGGRGKSYVRRKPNSRIGTGNDGAICRRRMAAPRGTDLSYICRNNYDNNNNNNISLTCERSIS